MAYLQAALQAEVALVTGQPYGSFASLNGVPLSMDFITAADLVDGERRGFGQSCLSEENAVYDVRAPGPPPDLLALRMSIRCNSLRREACASTQAPGMRWG